MVVKHSVLASSEESDDAQGREGGMEGGHTSVVTGREQWNGRELLYS